MTFKILNHRSGKWLKLTNSQKTNKSNSYRKLFKLKGFYLHYRNNQRKPFLIFMRFWLELTSCTPWMFARAGEGRNTYEVSVCRGSYFRQRDSPLLLTSSFVFFHFLYSFFSTYARKVMTDRTFVCLSLPGYFSKARQERSFAHAKCVKISWLLFIVVIVGQPVRRF